MRTAAGYGSDGSGGSVDAADALVVRVGKVEVADCIDGQALGRIDERGSGGATVAPKPCVPAPDTVVMMPVEAVILRMR